MHLLTSRILQLLDDNYIDVVFVPPNCTDQPQPLHLSFNKAVKDFMRGKFQKWYSNQGLVWVKGWYEANSFSYEANETLRGTMAYRVAST